MCVVANTGRVDRDMVRQHPQSSRSNFYPAPWQQWRGFLYGGLAQTTKNPRTLPCMGFCLISAITRLWCAVSLKPIGSGLENRGRLSIDPFLDVLRGERGCLANAWDKKGHAGYLSIQIKLPDISNRAWLIFG